MRIVKIRYYKHTAVKHEILKNYLKPWAKILGTADQAICYFDGFAGPGRYDGQPGSPLIAIERAEEASAYVRQVICVNVEKNKDYYENLVTETHRRASGAVQVIEVPVSQIGCQVASYGQSPTVGAKVVVLNACGSFEDAAGSVASRAGTWPPTFFFIDPGGIKGVPFGVIQALLRLKSTEVMLTFMVEAAKRCLAAPKTRAIAVSLFGAEECLNLRGEFALRDLYVRRLKETRAARWVMPFRMRRTYKRTTIYYLIHASNHFLAFKIMKEIMHKQAAPGADGFLGPDDRAARETGLLFADQWLPEFKEWLRERFRGKTVSFRKVMEETYDMRDEVEPQYRQALLSLEEEGEVRIRRPGAKRKDRLSHADRVSFLP
jgi:three-Cys-motif partner protein